jgi:polar amino acid transport system substrate-binding protein
MVKVRMRAIFRICLCIMIVLGGNFLLTACKDGGDRPSGDSSAKISTFERIRKEGVIHIGYANEAPYAYKDTETGEVTGEAPEIARVVAKVLGVEKVESVLTEFGSLIPGLKAARFDVIAAGMYIKPLRCEQINFSNPTYGIGEAIAVQTGNPKGLHSYADIRDKGAVLAVVTGAIELSYARAVGIPEDQIKRYGDAPSALQALAAGRVDAYGGTALTVQDLVDKEASGKVERAAPFTDPVINGKSVRGYGAFGFRKGDIQLRDAFNACLAGFIGSEAHMELVRPFGFTESELPGDATAEELCRQDAK